MNIIKLPNSSKSIQSKVPIRTIITEDFAQGRPWFEISIIVLIVMGTVVWAL
jgi:hypothetical protein